jgi:hypothetical protein
MPSDNDQQDADKRPSAAFSGRLTALAAWQKVAPYSSRRHPRPSSLQRTSKYASLLRISGALHLAIFEHPGKNHFFSSL